MGAVSRHGADRVCDLIEQICNRCDVTEIIRRQFHVADLLGGWLDREMPFTPAPADLPTVFLSKSLTFAVNLQSGASDRKTQRLAPPDRMRQNFRPLPRRLNVVWSGSLMATRRKSAIEPIAPSG